METKQLLVHVFVKISFSAAGDFSLSSSPELCVTPQMCSDCFLIMTVQIWEAQTLQLLSYAFLKHTVLTAYRMKFRIAIHFVGNGNCKIFSKENFAEKQIRM